MESEKEESESQVAQKWLSFCRSHDFVKCVEFDVPGGILPAGYKGTLIDVKVGKKKGWGGPDDRIYSQHEDLRQNVARGNCVLELHTVEKINGNSRQDIITSTNYFFMIFALRKFSGGFGDEDDSEIQNMWQNYFIKPPSAAKKVICTTKANGEAAHVSCRSIGGQNYFAIGSKNVHMLAQTIDDVEKYTDSRFEVARTVARAFFNHIKKEKMIESGKLNSLVEYLQSNRYTAIFELLQPEYQHVENLSYLSEPELRFICWVDLYTGEDYSEISSLSISPNTAIEKARELGLLTIDYDEICAEDAEDEMQKIRDGWEYEGKVLYFVDEDNHVIGLIKKKTRWYIILRAIREKAAAFTSSKKECSNSAAERKSKVTKRLKELQTWLGFSNEYRQNWTELGCTFIQWVIDLNKREHSSNTSVRSHFPPLWSRFLQSHEKENIIYNNLRNLS